MRRRPLPFQTPKWVDRKHGAHVRTIKKPVPGNMPHAEGHSLRMVQVTTTSFECQCGVKLQKPGQSKRKRT